jgi:hypothetical protein
MSELNDNRFHPYTKDEFKHLKDVINNITTHIPNSTMGYIWSNHNKILNTNESQPCSCGSAAAHWNRAIQTIREFVRSKESLLLSND